MTYIEPLLQFVKDSIYTDLANGFNLFPFLAQDIYVGISLGDILATVITIGIVGLIISLIVGLVVYAFKLLKRGIRI